MVRVACCVSSQLPSRSPFKYSSVHELKPKGVAPGRRLHHAFGMQEYVRQYF
jgi:hypothetical protein